MYQGELFRYLGHDTPKGCANKIIPEYNNVYVSWSKHPENDYIESKLYGIMTHLTCFVQEPYYGIDLEPFGVVKANEAEVVFPTIKDVITNIEYINYKEE